MKVQMFIVGTLSTNCYILICENTKEAIIIDPGFNSNFEKEKIQRFIEQKKLTLKFIVNTHGHPDHTCGNEILKEKFNVPIMIHENDADMLGKKSQIFGLFGFQSFSPPADVMLREGDIVKFGKTSMRVMHTPGHSMGSISLLGEKEVFVGDTLFLGSIGRIDFPESSEREMKTSLKKLACLPDYFVVYPGHGPTTTIGEEKLSNPFLQRL